MVCKSLYKPTGSCSKVCPECKPQYEQARAHAYHIEHYEKTGYNQARENNNSWAGGIGVFTEMAFKDYGFEKVCMRCGSTKHILVHHKDRNRRNNTKENHEILCKSCHQKEHSVRDSEGRYAKQSFKE